MLTLVDQLHGVVKVCSRGETFLVDMNDWDCASRDELRSCGSDGTTVACSSSGTVRELVSNESCLLDFVAAARDDSHSQQRKTIGKCVRQQTWHPGSSWALRRIRPQFWSNVPRWRRKISWTRWESMTSFRGPLLRRKDAVPFAPGGVTVNSGSDDAPQLRARWVAQEFRGHCGDKHEYFSETPDLALVKAVIAHAARRAESEDIVIVVFDVRRAYFYTEEKRDTLLNYWTMYFLDSESRWKAAQGVVQNTPGCSIVER